MKPTLYPIIYVLVSGTFWPLHEVLETTSDMTRVTVRVSSSDYRNINVAASNRYVRYGNHYLRFQNWDRTTGRIVAQLGSNKTQDIHVTRLDNIML
jgi:hypothetical protein